METLASNPRVTYRVASAEDIEGVTGEKPVYSVKALAFFYDGELAGIGGYKIHNGSYVAFSDIKKGVEAPKLTIYRCALIIMDLIKSKGLPMFASAENPELCERLGFERFNGDLYKWPS